jgi:HEAT repeat protein
MRPFFWLLLPVFWTGLAGCQEAALKHHARQLHEDPARADRAAQELAMIGEAAGPTLLQATHSPLLHERVAATRYLTVGYREGLPTPEVVTRLVELMEDPEEQVRLAAMDAVNNHLYSSPQKCRDALAETWHPVVPTLARAAQEGEENTRTGAIGTLAHLAEFKIRADEIIRVLTRCLNEPEGQVTSAAADGLRRVANLAGPDLVGPLLDCLGRNIYDGAISRTLIDALLGCTQEDIEAWFRELDSPQPVRRAAAAFAMGVAFSQRAGHVLPHTQHTAEGLERLKARQKVETVEHVRLRIMDAIGRIEWAQQSLNVLAMPR